MKVEFIAGLLHSAVLHVTPIEMLSSHAYNLVSLT